MELSPVLDPLLGRVVAGKYVIESRLGGGAMGTVYKARQVALERAVAIKVMRVELASDRSFVGRFHREARAASKLSHPNSISVTDFGEEADGLLYIVMELVMARDLERLIWEDGLPLLDRRIVDILAQVLSVVANAHDVGIVHRDLKPANILVVAGDDDEGNPTEHVKVCDFGIASMRNTVEAEPVATAPVGPPRLDSGKKLTAIGALLGTPEYMSPEQASGSPLDLASDIYSVGAILYELLTGRTVYLADSPAEMVLRQVTGTPDPPGSVRPCNALLAAICLRALAKDPKERFPSARAMRSELRAALGQVVSSRALSMLPSSSTATALSLSSVPTEPPPPVKIPAARTSETLTSIESHPPSASRHAEAQPTKPGRRWALGLAGLVLLGIAVGGGATVLRPPRGGAAIPAAEPMAQVAAARAREGTSSATPSAADIVADLEFSDKPSPGPWARVIPSRPAPIPSAAKVAAETPTVRARDSARPPEAPAPAIPSPPTSGVAVTPSSIPEAVPAPAPAPAVVVMTPFSPDAAHVTASVASAARTSRAGIASVVSHVSFDACYRDALRTLGRAEGGAGSAHLEIDEDGVVRGAEVRLPAPLARATECIASKLRGQRMSVPDTGAATGDIAFVFVPN